MPSHKRVVLSAQLTAACSNHLGPEISQDLDTFSKRREDPSMPFLHSLAKDIDLPHHIYIHMEQYVQSSFYKNLYKVSRLV